MGRHWKIVGIPQNSTFSYVGNGYYSVPDHSSLTSLNDGLYDWMSVHSTMSTIFMIFLWPDNEDITKLFIDL